jgi:hypothetical protein
VVALTGSGSCQAADLRLRRSLDETVLVLERMNTPEPHAIYY